MNVVLACAICNLDPASPLSKGAFWGVLVLVLIVGGVLGGFGSMFVFWMHRARALERQLAIAQAGFPVEEPSVDDVPAWRDEDPTAPPPLSVH